MTCAECLGISQLSHIWRVRTVPGLTLGSVACGLHVMLLWTLLVCKLSLKEAVWLVPLFLLAIHK